MTSVKRLIFICFAFLFLCVILVVIERMAFGKGGFFFQIEPNDKLSLYINKEYGEKLKDLGIHKIKSVDCIFTCIENLTYYDDNGDKLGGVRNTYISNNGHHQIELIDDSYVVSLIVNNNDSYFIAVMSVDEIIENVIEKKDD